MKITKAFLFVFSLFILLGLGAYSASAATVEDSVTVGVIATPCSVPLVNGVCPISIKPDLKVQINNEYVDTGGPVDGPVYTSYDPVYRGNNGQGFPYTLSWGAVANATSCKLDGVAVAVAGDTLTKDVSVWASNGTVSSHTYNLVCTDSSGNTGSDSLILSYPTVVNLTSLCSSDNTKATISWTAPAGITKFYTRASGLWDGYPKTQLNGWKGTTALYKDGYTSTSDTFTVHTGDTIDYFIHAEAPNGAYGPATHGPIFQCPPAGTLTGPASCTIGTGNSTCPATVTWNVTNPVTGKPTAVTADKPVANTTIGSGNSGNVSTPIRNGTTYFYLYHNGIEVASRIPILGSCDLSKDTWDGTKCVKIPTNSWVIPTCTNTACGSPAVTIPYTCPTGNCAPLPAPTRICSAAAACPLVTLTATPSKVRKGGSSTLKWTGADSTCTAKLNSFTFDGSPTGQDVVTNIQKATTFILSCGGVDYPATVTIDTTTFIEQ